MALGTVGRGRSILQYWVSSVVANEDFVSQAGLDTTAFVLSVLIAVTLI